MFKQRKPLSQRQQLRRRRWERGDGMMERGEGVSDGVRADQGVGGFKGEHLFVTEVSKALIVLMSLGAWLLAPCSGVALFAAPSWPATHTYKCPHARHAHQLG